MSGPGGLRGRVVVVTGGGQGLGAAYTRHLVGCGARVAVIDVLADTATGLADELTRSPSPADVRGYAADVTDESAVQAVVDDVVDRWGVVHALVNNAGGALLPSGPFDAVTRADWDRVLAVNLTGQWVCARAVVPVMRAAGYGKLVNVSSTMVARGYPVGLAPYITAKAGVVGLTRALAQELGAAGIRVNALSPGYTPVATAKATHAPEAAARLRQRMRDEQCLPRTETPEDLCGAVEFLCSPASDFVTGQVLNVDGGWALG